MDRASLENLSINELRELAGQYKVDTKGSRVNILERLLNHFERAGWSEQVALSNDKGTSENMPVAMRGQITSEEELNSISGPNPSATSEPATMIRRAEDTIERSRDNGTVTGLDINDIVQFVVQVLQGRQRDTSSAAAIERPRASGIHVPLREVNQGSSQNWQQVKCAGKLLPPFSGKDEVNVTRWLERVASIACMYQFDDNVLLLASVSQLKERALDWYNRQPLDSVSSWEEFKFQVRRYFERKETYTATLARISARIWKSHTEKFVEYAEAKLNLMQFLTLSEREKIELLADGVKDFTLRKLVLNTWIDNVPDFIEHVRRITEDTVLVRRGETISKYPNKKASITSGKSDSSGEKSCFTCKKTGHLSRDCRVARATCFKCGQVGHLSTTCPKRQANHDATLNHVEQQEACSSNIGLSTPEKDTQIGQIRSDDGAKSYIHIRRLSNREVNIRALVDTGSPVNLIKKSIYERLFNNRELFRVKNGTNYKGINESPVLIYGKIYDQIILDDVKDSWFDIVFLIVDDKTMRYDVILGREFLNTSNLKLTYCNNHFAFEYVNRYEEVPHDILTINAIEFREKYDVVLDNLDKDLSIQDRRDLLNTLKESDEMQVKKIDDDYCVSVYLKDHSFFRYAPRDECLLRRKTNYRKS